MKYVGALVHLPLLLAACSSAPSSRGDGLVVSPASEVRQGQSGIRLTLTREGGGLANPSQVDFQDLDIVVAPGSTDVRLELAVTVPHGALLGPKTLTITTPIRTTTAVDAVDVTAITAGPEGLDSELGTAHAPFRSLEQALRVSDSGDTVTLHGGTYRESSGEAWGYVVPDGLTISGDGASTTLLESDAQAPSGLEPSARLTVRDLSLSGFAIGIKAGTAAQLSLQSAEVRGSISALEVDGDDVTVDVSDSQLSASSEAALRVADGSHRSQVSVRGARLTGGVFDADSASALLVDATTIDARASSAGINFGGAKLDVSASEIQVGAGSYGVSLRSGAASFAHVTIQGGAYGVYQLTGSSKLRDTRLHGYETVGLYYASGAVDLGTATEAGNNAFSGSSAHLDAYGIYINLDTSPVTCSNTSFNGVIPDAGTVKAGADAISVAGAYLLNPGQTLQFFRVN